MTPAPTVRPPSRIAKRLPSSNATGVINSTIRFTLSPGITISTPSGSSTARFTASGLRENGVRDLVKKAVAVLMISSELPEVLGMCDRILVMHEGRLSGVFAGVLLLSAIDTAITLMAIPPHYQQVVRAGLVLLAVLLDSMKTAAHKRLV